MRDGKPVEARFTIRGHHAHTRHSERREESLFCAVKYAENRNRRYASQDRT
jgi:hypothetical protein